MQAFRLLFSACLHLCMLAIISVSVCLFNLSLSWILSTSEDSQEGEKQRTQGGRVTETIPAHAGLSISPLLEGYILFTQKVTKILVIINVYTYSEWSAETLTAPVELIRLTGCTAAWMCDDSSIAEQMDCIETSRAAEANTSSLKGDKPNDQEPWFLRKVLELTTSQQIH